MTPDRASDIIKSRLLPSERVVWQDTPRPWSISWPYLGYVLFTLVSCIFIICGLFSAFYGLMTGRFGVSFENIIAVLLVVLVVLFALFYIACLIVQKIYTAYNTTYALTNLRVIVAVGSSGIESYKPEDLAWVRRNCSGNRGDVVFSEPTLLVRSSSSRPVGVYLRIDEGDFKFFGSLYRIGPLDEPGLYDVNEPARVQALIRETLLQPSKEGAPV